jgi:hypothetical protein
MPEGQSPASPARFLNIVDSPTTRPKQLLNFLLWREHVTVTASSSNISWNARFEKKKNLTCAGYTPPASVPSMIAAPAEPDDDCERRS